jgi:hypothetical protein
VRQQMNEIIKSRVSQTCSTTLVPLLPDDTHPTVVQLAVSVATKKVALLCEDWAKEYVVDRKRNIKKVIFKQNKKYSDL